MWVTKGRGSSVCLSKRYCQAVKGEEMKQRHCGRDGTYLHEFPVEEKSYMSGSQPAKESWLGAAPSMPGHRGICEPA